MMAHDHSHHHDPQSYYLEQLFTIGVCGALGLVACLRWLGWFGSLFFIAEKFQLLVLFGGVLLLALAAVRAVALWTSVGEPRVEPVHGHDLPDAPAPAPSHAHEHGAHAHSHEHGAHAHSHEHGVHAHSHEHHHEHGPGCDHDHGHSHAVAASPSGVAVAAGPAAAVAPPTDAGQGHGHGHGHDQAHDHDHDHDHDHGHSHGWAPWRFVVLLLPVMLFFLQLPSEGYSSGQDISGEFAQDSAGLPATNKGGDILSVSFPQVAEWANSDTQRQDKEGQLVRLTGQYVGSDPKRFTLTRYKMTCCAPDAVPLNAVILIDSAWKDKKLDYNRYRNRWVEVVGRVHFQQLPASSAYAASYMTVLILSPPEKIEEGKDPLDEMVKVIPTPADPWAR
jgi:hypothetical protein